MKHAVDLDRSPAQHERAAAYVAGAAVREAWFGNAREARQNAAAARNLSKGRDVEYGAALALAIAGDTAEALAIAAGLTKRYPDDTFVKSLYVPEIGALAALHGKDPAKAVELLQVSAPYDLAAQGGAIGFYGDLYSPYIRGLGYSAQGRGAEAATEFRKVLDTPGMVVCDPAGAIAHLELGRAMAAAGDASGAKAAYGDFLNLWKDADPDIPLFKQAKAEYMALR